MMINQNNAVAFYGQRPVLSHHLPGQSHGHLAGPATSIAQIYMPGSVGTQLVGSLVDKIADKIGGVLTENYPTLGTVLYAIADFLDWCIEPTARYVEAMAEGAVLFLPTDAADVVLAYMEKNKTDVALDAFKDTLYARQKRMTPYTGASAKSSKEGRDTVLVTLMEFITKQLGVAQQSERLANKLYQVAIDAGASDWQAGAAVGYGVAIGLRQKGFPKDFAFQVPYTDKQIKLSMGNESDKLMMPVPAVATKFLSKLATPVPADLNDTEALIKWIEDNFEEKSGVKRRPGSKGGGGALPLLAAAAALFALNR